MEGNFWWAVIAGGAAFLGGIVTNPTFIDLMVRVAGNLKFWTVVDSFEQAVILRWGAGKQVSPGGHPYHKLVGPGIHWRYPLSDQAMKLSVILESQTYAPQVFKSASGTPYLCQFHVLYEVSDPVVHLLDVADTDSVMVDAVAGTCRKVISKLTDEELLTENLEQMLTARTRSRASRFGIAIERVYISELAQVGLRNGVIRHSGSVGAHL